MNPKMNAANGPQGAPDRSRLRRRAGSPGRPCAHLREVGERLGPERVDRLWIFPPLFIADAGVGTGGRGGCFDGSGARRLVTARYAAQRTGKGLYSTRKLVDQGVAPADRLPRVMEGVVKRGPAPLGSPRPEEVGGSAEAFDALMEDFAGELFEEAVIGPPAAE